jgi:DNA-binding transcriptional regulator/RsmH inhibitor MraZ
MSEWVQLQNSLTEKAKTGAEMAKAIKTQRRIASHFGGTTSIDAQGRVLVPAELRKELSLDGKRVKIDFELGRYNFWLTDQYKGLVGEALNEIDGANALLEDAGLL